MTSAGGNNSRNISHYLLRPLRSYDEAQREQARRLQEIEDAKAAPKSPDGPASPALPDKRLDEKV